MIKENAAGAILFFRKNDSLKYLILKYKVHGQTHWDFVKGSIEKGETELEAAKREAFEETGIGEVNLIEGFTDKIVYSYKQDDGQIAERTLTYFLFEVPIEANVKLSGEHSAFKWMDFGEVSKYLKFKNQIDTLEKANSFLLG